MAVNCFVSVSWRSARRVSQSSMLFWISLMFELRPLIERVWNGQDPEARETARGLLRRGV